MKFTDPSGNSIIATLIGLAINYISQQLFSQPSTSNISDVEQNRSSAIGTVVGLAVSFIPGANGILKGILMGGITGGISGGLTAGIDAAFSHKDFGQAFWAGFKSGAITGGASGGVQGYFAAKAKNLNVWTGTPKRNDYLRLASYTYQNVIERPTYAEMDANFPKDVYGNNVTGPNMYELVGGDVYDFYLISRNPNACALRVSYALNKSGVRISQQSGTFMGEDGNYYFLSSRKLDKWLNTYFGAPDKVITSNFETNLQGYRGIYILHAKSPGLFGALGHATVFNGTTCIDNCYFGATGGINKINLWILK